MKILRKSMTLLLTLALVITMMPVGASYAFGAESSTATSAGGDAFAAIGIDTSVAPDGYDADSIDNPYGRSTIKVNTVSELYTVGLSKDVSTINDAEKNAETSSESAKGEISQIKDETGLTNKVSLNATLYGDGSGLKSTTKALDKNLTGTVSSGKVTATGNYAKLNTGTHKYYENMGTYGKYTHKNYLTGLHDATSDQGVMSDVAAGNFDKNEEGKSAQIAMVYTKGYSAKGGLYLKFGDAKGTTDKAYGDSIELLSQSKKLGNPDLKLENEDGSASDKNAENFAENPYQLKNYLQVATGDWNGDGVDEVAVYIPEENNSRIAVYALQRTEKDAYKNPSNWALAWTYYLKEDNVVSNMISMTSGDVDRDGIDDLSCTWGYYYGPTQNKGSKAVVMFGGKDKEILKRSQQFDISYGSSNIVRASFVFGDIGTGEDSLILCGQADADLKAGNTYSRYVAMYVWNGKKFATNLDKNFNLFERDKDGNLVHAKMSGHGEKGKEMFYSLPLCSANTAIINKGIKDEGGNKLYFDSLIFKYEKTGLELAEAWDIASFMPGNSTKEYVEYDGTAGDMTGQTGAGALMTVTQTLSNTVEAIAKYTEEGPVQVPVYARESYYKNWFYKLIKKKSYRTVLKGNVTKTGSNMIDQKYTKTTWGDTYMVVASPSESNYFKQQKVNTSFSLCLANTDNDSSYMNYAGNHYYRYTDPKVLAVLASPPYFKDLLDRDDLSGNYAESTTSYSSTTGSESGSTGGTTITVGAYVSFEQEISVFGVKIGQTEAETVVTHGFTWETEKTSSLEQTVSYSATSGEDKVALYSIPMEIYQYESYVPDENGNYEKVITEVNLPHEACIKLLDLSEYETIAEDYSILPTIAESVLRHEIGDPSSYPSSTAGYNVIAQYNGTPASVGFTSKGGGDTISQEIAMSESNSNSYSYVGNVEAKAGAGAGGVTVGVIAGFEGTGGTVHITTEGSSFSGELQAMPAEAKPYGYNMNWKIFCYKYKSADMEFPVVSYLVTDVQQPASLPEDFEQNVAETTADSVTLTWTYDKFVSGFQLYRYYEFPDGSGSYRLEYVPFSKGKKNGDKYEFTYTDKGLSPYTEYKYQIQTESTYNPKVSIYSEPISCRTKTTIGYPQMTVSGLVKDGKDKGKLAIYPDAEGEAIVTVADENQYKSLSYQWQKLVGGEWKNMPAFKTNKLTIANASAADKGTYRCRVNAIYFDETSQKEFSISAYTDAFETVYTKRTPEVVLSASAETYGVNKDINGIHAEVELHSANKNNTTAPKGTVTFTIEGKDYENTKVAPLTPSASTKSFDMGNNVTENKYYSKASIDFEKLAEGTYTVKYYYSGDNVFKDKTQEIGQIVAVGNSQGYVLNMKNADKHTVTKFTYGDEIVPTLYTVVAGTSDTTEVQDTVSYKYKTSQKDALQAFTNGQKLDAGKYTMYAYTSNESDAEPVASAAFTVEKKALIVSAVKIDNVSDIAKTPPQLETDVTGVTAADIDVEYKAYNSAGNETKLSSDEPGNYTIMPCFKKFESAADIAASEAKRANYDVSFQSAVYTVIGQIYALQVSAEQYTDKNHVSKDVGTAAISETGLAAGNYTRGSVVQLYAAPDEGYEVEKWVVSAAGYPDEIYKATVLKAEGKNPNRLNLTMKPGATTVKVYFKVKETYLNLIKTIGGDISCISDEYFESGAQVHRGAEHTFKATPKSGYTFGQWIISETGFSSVYNKGTVAEDGTSTIKITMGTNDIGLQAAFIRDSYTVNLEGNIEAYYLKESNDPTNTNEKITITSGNSVKGDTEIHVAPKTGYIAAENAKITVNGKPTDSSTSYKFNLTENTTISLETVRESYKVEAAAETATEGIAGGKVVITADGTEVESGNNVDGGSKVVFRAVADRGFVFDHWVIGDDTSMTADEYVIDEIGAATTVKAIFKENSKNTLTGVVSPVNRGKLVYTLYDIYGNVLEENKDYENAIEMYKGESVDISAAPASGSMVEQWIMKEGAGEKKFVSSSKNYPGGKITMKDSNIEIQAIMVSSTSYKLYFNAADSSTGTMTVTSDGTAIQTGDTIPGGADVVFTAEPVDGKMVDYWTITKGAASVTPTAENTVTLTDEDGDNFVNPVYEINGYKGNQTVRVYFKDLGQKNISVTGSNADVEFTYATPIKKGDATKPTGTSIEARTDGTVKLTITPKEGFATSLAEVKEAFSGCSEKMTAEYKDGTYYVTLKKITEAKTVDVNVFIDKLYHVTAEGTNCAVGTITSDKTADGAASGMVREGSNVTFTLTPDSGYGTSAADLVKETTGLTTSYNGGVYTMKLSSVSADTALNFHMDKLYQVSAGKNCTVSDFKSSLSCETAAVNQARSGATVTFKLTPAEGYRVNAAAVKTWSQAVSGTDENPTGMTLLTTTNEDKTLDVQVTGILDDITAPDNLFTPISSGGGAFPMPPAQVTDDSENKISTEENVGVSGQVVVKVIAEAAAGISKDGQSLELTLTKEQQEALIKTAVDKKADEVIIRTGELSEELTKLSETMSIIVSTEMAADILEKTDAALTIETPNGDLKLDQKALEAAIKQTGTEKNLTFNVKKEALNKYHKIVGKTAYIFSLELFAGKTQITDFGKGKVQIKQEIPNTLAGREIIAVYITDTGRLEKFQGETVTEKVVNKDGKEIEKKYYSFQTTHFSVYALAEKAEVDAYEKTQRTITGVKKTSVKLTAASTAKRKAKLTWKKSKGYKADAYEVYRATSKNGKYVKVFTTKSAAALSYTGSKKLKSGKKYYFKVRGVRTIDGKKYYTKWSNISSLKIQ